MYSGSWAAPSSLFFRLRRELRHIPSHAGLALISQGKASSGSYEHKLFGFDGVLAEDDDDMSISLVPVFAYAPHAGCVKAVRISGNGGLLASGSTDEHIKLYNLKSRRELGDLIQHQGSITALAFYNKSHLLSGAADGVIAVWRTKDWECLKLLRGHKGDVHDVALHPSGRLALSVGKDRTIRLWNLLKGRSAYVKTLPGEAHRVVWSPQGTRYAVATDKSAIAYSLEDGKELAEIKSTAGYVNSICFVDDEHLALGLEDGTARIHDAATGAEIRKIAAHDKRVKGLKAVPSPLAEDAYWLVTVSSDGSVKVWDVGAADSTEDAECCASIETNARLTCMDAVSLMTAIETDTAAENGSGEALDELEGSDDAEEEEDGEGEGEGEDDGDSSADSEAGEWVKVGSDMPSQASSEEEESEEDPAPKKRKQQVQQKASGAKKQKVASNQQKQSGKKKGKGRK